MKKLTLVGIGAVAAMTVGLAMAQTEEAAPMAGMDHSAMDMPGAMKGYVAAMDTMMTSMPMKSTGDPDADFLAMMIPHHQSAIDMAKIELAEGDDPATRALAQKVIDAQEAEIAEMKAMLKAMGM
jgi:uncharacterized protein (DUF305 family)